MKNCGQKGFAIPYVNIHFCQAQLQLSAQLKAELALFSFNTATHPTMKVVKRKETSSISIEDF